MEKADLIRVFASLSPEEKAAIIGQASTARAPSSPKFSTTLDRVAEGDVAGVVKACRKGLRLVATNPDRLDDLTLDAVALGELEVVDPVVAAAARDNSIYRGKPYAHSLAVATEYLQSEQAEAKRAARRRRVSAEPDKKQKQPAAAPAGASTDGGK